MPKPTRSTTTSTANPSQGCCRRPQRQDVRMLTSSVSPGTALTPSRGRPRNPPCPVRHSGPCPESSSVPDPVSPGQSGGSRPCCLAPLCVSSQADYCPWANILIQGSRQAIAPTIPHSPSCHFPPSWRVWGSAEVSGAQHNTGSWAWSRFLEVQQDRTGLGYPGKGFFPLPADALLPPPQPGELGASFQPHSAAFLRQKGHTKKPITQPNAPKRGRKSLEQV